MSQTNFEIEMKLLISKKKKHVYECRRSHSCTRPLRRKSQDCGPGRPSKAPNIFLFLNCVDDM